MAAPRDPMALLFGTATGYQRSAALKAAVDLDLFTAIAEGKTDVDSLARRCEASPRGIRILGDSLVAFEVLEKTDGRYALPADLAPFLDRRSPMFVVSFTSFLVGEPILRAFSTLTDAVRKGGTAMSEEGSTEAEHPMWVEFARAMAPMMRFHAGLVAGLLRADQAGPWKVLDVAAGHGAFGLALATQNPNAEIVFLDWKSVLTVAEENARKTGVADRVRLLPGNAFTVDFGSGYDIVLLPNFLHHFDVPTCESLLRRVHAALKPGGRAVTVEFVPNADRVTPPDAAAFSLVMLASTPAGDAYTFSELERMCANAGFAKNELHEIPPSPQRVVISTR